MRQRGLTLLELMVTIGLSTFVMMALAWAFSVATRTSALVDEPVRSFEATVALEDQIRELISKAYISDTESDPNTYFVGRASGGGISAGNAGADELIFTMAGKRIKAAAIESQESEFESRNEQFGPIGGVTEVGLSTVPIGSAGNRQGLFVREQSPADSNIEQGGYERVLDPRISSIAFEFYESQGQQWATEWDSQTQGSLPAAVRVTYSLNHEDDLTRSFVVRLETTSLPSENTVTVPAERNARPSR